MSNGTKECWASDANARSMRVETPGEGSFLLPLAHFLYAELKPGGEEIRAVFTTHEVTLLGTALWRLVGVLQRGELSFVTSISDPADGHDNEPVIRHIVVKEGGNPGAAMPGHQAA